MLGIVGAGRIGFVLNEAILGLNARAGGAAPNRHNLERHWMSDPRGWGMLTR